MAAVLIVDDSLAIRELVTKVLSEQGHQVFTAATLPQARDWLWAIRFDCVILDILLDGDSGLDLLPDLIDMDYKGKVVIVSGYAKNEVARDILYKVANCGLSVHFLEKTGNWVEEVFA